jgi:dTDP-glucose pyrophosphorylase
MAHWIDAISEYKKRPVKINVDAIGYMVQDEPNGLTHIHFIGSNYASGKPDLLVLESPEMLTSRMEQPQ